MLTDFQSKMFEKAEGFALAGECLRARCFFGGVVGEKQLCADQVTDLLEAVTIRVVDDARKKKELPEEEVEFNLAAATFVSLSGLVQEPMFAEDVIERVMLEACPDAVCPDKLSPNPAFIEHVVGKLYEELESVDVDVSALKTAVPVVFSAMARWLGEAIGRGFFTEQESVEVLQNLGGTLMFTTLGPAERKEHTN